MMVFFGHNAEFAIEDSDALREGNEFAGHGVVATHEIRAFAAGDFHAGGADIILPCLAFGENDALGRRLPAVVAFVADVEHVGTSEPGFVDEVVLCIANPGRVKTSAICLVRSSCCSRDLSTRG